MHQENGGDSSAPSDLSLLRQYMRAMINDSFAGDELTLALGARINQQDIPASDPYQRSLLMLKQALAAWQAEKQANGRPLFEADAPGMLRDVAANLAEHVGLLTDVFGLRRVDVANALGIPEKRVSELQAAERQARQVQLSGIALVVEDDPIIAQGVADVVMQAGLQVSSICASVESAVRASKQNPPDVLVCDYDLGDGGNGADAARIIQAEYNCPVIFVTAYPDLVLTGADFEPTFVLTKPCANETLRAALYYALTREGFSLIDGEERL